MEFFSINFTCGATRDARLIREQRRAIESDSRRERFRDAARDVGVLSSGLNVKSKSASLFGYADIATCLLLSTSAIFFIVIFHRVFNVLRVSAFGFERT